MEKQIRAYEKFIEQESKRKLSAAEREKLVGYHRDMMANFQCERLIHLIVTLFFALFMMVAIFVTAWLVVSYGWVMGLLPVYLLTLILVVLTGCYVRHYYFLENHIQGLYKYNKSLLDGGVDVKTGTPKLV